VMHDLINVIVLILNLLGSCECSQNAGYTPMYLLLVYVDY
jgi:hypothetical protein